MYLVLLGALLELAGMVFLVGRAIMREPRAIPLAGQETLEPAGTAGPSLKGYWPGIAMLAVGALLLLAGGRMSGV
jgi:hypothetical protein